MEEKDFKHDETVKQEKQVQLLAKRLILTWILVGNMVVLGLIIVVVSIVIHNHKGNNVVKDILTQATIKKPQDLKAFLREQPYVYLGGKEWINNYIKNVTNGNFWTTESLFCDEGYISALVEDFDGDGEDELLLITIALTNPYSYDFDTNEVSYRMYEWVNEQWHESSVWQTNFYTFGRDYCKIDMFSKRYDGKIYLFFNSYLSSQFTGANGFDWTFKEIVYTNNNFILNTNMSTGTAGSGRLYNYPLTEDINYKEYSKFGFTLDANDGKIFDNDTSIQKIARIQMNSLLEEESGRMFISSNMDSYLTEFPAINVQILDFAGGNGQVAENFETYFQKNPIDLAIELERGIQWSSMERRVAISNYIEIWKNETFHAYESLIALSQDDEKEQVEKEYNSYRENIHTFQHEAYAQALIESETVDEATIIDVGLMGVYNAFREHAKELYKRIYAKNTLYVYSFSPAQRHTQLQAQLLDSLQGQLQEELLEPFELFESFEPFEPQTTESSSFFSLYDSDYIFPDSNRRYLTEEEVAEVDLHALFIARNEIYARYGRLFHDSGLQDYFDSMDWYHGTILPEDFDSSLLNVYEVANIHLFLQFEEEID